jgi:hypothetical protein
VSRWRNANEFFTLRAPGLVPRPYLVSVTQKAEIQRLLQMEPKPNELSTKFELVINKVIGLTIPADCGRDAHYWAPPGHRRRSPAPGSHRT